MIFDKSANLELHIYSLEIKFKSIYKHRLRWVQGDFSIDPEGHQLQARM